MLIDVECGIYGFKVGILWDGYVVVWFMMVKIDKCFMLWMIVNCDKLLFDY